MRVLVTGGGGFLGSQLCRELIEAGHSVAVLLRGAVPWRIRPIERELTMIGGDLSALASCAASVAAFKPDAVAHLAWSGVANFARNDPGQVANIAWTADLVLLAREAGAKVFLGLGSQAEYGPKSGRIKADDETCPTTLYGESKLAAGRIAARLAADAGMRFVWMRLFSTYGPADHPYWMIPGLIGHLLKGDRPPLTAGDQSWDFLHVADAARCLRLALESDAARGVYPFGSGRAPRLRTTIELIRDQIDSRLPLGFGDIPYRPDQVMLLEADISPLRQDLGWEPKVDLTDGIADTVAWYRANQWIFDRECARS